VDIHIVHRDFYAVSILSIMVFKPSVGAYSILVKFNTALHRQRYNRLGPWYDRSISEFCLRTLLPLKGRREARRAQGSRVVRIRQDQTHFQVDGSRLLSRNYHLPTISPLIKNFAPSSSNFHGEARLYISSCPRCLVPKLHARSCKKPSVQCSKRVNGEST